MEKIERTQTGIRLEKRILKVLKGLAEHLDMTLSELIEGMALHNFEGHPPFSKGTLDTIAHLKSAYGLTLTAKDAHNLTDTSHDTQ